jgi:hypothetical protein
MPDAGLKSVLTILPSNTKETEDCMNPPPLNYGTYSHGKIQAGREGEQPD